MLWICDDGHAAITYQSRDCPVCQQMEVVGNLTIEIDTLQGDLDDVTDELSDAEVQIGKLTDELENLKENGVVNKKIS